eukprot:TRINITY_DN4986_c0_g3_i1.p1 TRINITY_DN4986_c0_g3~~TRINITY_DN4986_c0_g3_i1.p1  ORF type:complete len:332 (+),score=67.87 TRINITY_DN4986_c0_g3_i1:871-1866(+)
MCDPAIAALLQANPKITHLQLSSSRSVTKTSFPSHALKNLVKLLVEASIDLSEAINLTTLKIRLGKNYHWMLDTPPRPGKITQLSIWTSNGSPSLHLDRFVNITKLKLDGSSTLTTFHHLQKVTLLNNIQKPEELKRLIGSSPIKHLTLVVRNSQGSQSDWLMAMPPSLTFLGLSLDNEIVGDVSKISFPNLRHFAPSNHAIQLLPIMKSIDTVSVWKRLEASYLPPSCTRLNIRKPQTSLAPQIRHLQLEDIDLERHLVKYVMVSHIEKITIKASPPKVWPSRKVLEKVSQWNGKFTDPMLNRLMEVHQRMFKEWEALRAEMPWYKTYSL